MFEHDFEKIGSAVSTHSENLKGFGFSAKKLAENPKKWRGLIPRIPSFLDVWLAGWWWWVKGFRRERGPIHSTHNLAFDTFCQLCQQYHILSFSSSNHHIFIKNIISSTPCTMPNLITFIIIYGIVVGERFYNNPSHCWNFQHQFYS